MDISKLQFDSKVIDELEIDSSQRETLELILNENDERKIEEMIENMIPIESETLSFDGAEEKDKKGTYNSIKCEVYKVLCTNDSTYAKERVALGDGLRGIIPILATSFVGTLGLTLPLTIVTGIIVALLMLVIKIGNNAWCSRNKMVCG